MKTIKIADVRVSPREVELPDVCPHCQGDLSDGKCYVLCYAQYVYFDSKLEEGDKIDLVFDPKFSESGVAWEDLPCQLVSCGHCYEPLVSSNIVYDVPPDRIREPLVIPRFMGREQLQRVLQQRGWK